VTNVLDDARTQRVPLHTRSLCVFVAREEDGGFRARGDVIDLRKNGCVPSVGDVQPTGIIHMMSIELDFEPETLTLGRIVVDQPFVAVEASKATGGECCRDPAPRLEAMTGERLDPGFNRRLGKAFGGPLGCSHLLTLFQLMASTIPYALGLEHARLAREGGETAPGTRFFRRSIAIDGDLSQDGSLDVAVQLTDTHTRPPFPGNRAFERLVGLHEVKCFAEIERKRFRVEQLELRERERDSATSADAAWTDHDAFVATLAGAPILPGMAGRLFALTGEDPAKRVVRDVLLQLAPGFIQIIAALMDHTVLRPVATGGSAPATASDPTTPSVSGLGGMPDSCYMWRRDSLYTLSRRESMLPRE